MTSQDDKLGVIIINGETYIMITDEKDEISEEGYLIRVSKEATHELNDISDIDLEIVDGKIVIAKCKYVAWVLPLKEGVER